MKEIIAEFNSLSPEFKKLLLILVAISVLLPGAVLVVLLQSGAGIDTSQNPPAVTTEDQPDQGYSFVEITGQVNKPGVYEIDGIVRVIELIDLAGGITADADMVYLHRDVKLSQIAEDGYKLFVPARSDHESVSASKISINTATKQQLTELPGIGNATAESIIAARPYATIEELLDVSGIGEQTLAKIESLVSL